MRYSEFISDRYVMGKQAGLITGLFDSVAGVGRGLFAGHRE